MCRNALLYISILFLPLMLNCNPTSSNNNAVNTLTDADGNVYATVTIGTQTWTTENLRTTKYNDGTAIPLVNNFSAWATLSTSGYCYYNNTNNSDSIKKFGALYNWYTIHTGKLAPAGWHVPSDAEWDTLQNYLILHGYNWDGTITCNKIAKSMAARTNWYTDTINPGVIGNNLSTNNRSGFSALPGGCRDEYGDFNVIGNCGIWWSATEVSSSRAYYRGLLYGSASLNGSNDNKCCGFSVRLLRN